MVACVRAFPTQPHPQQPQVLPSAPATPAHPRCPRAYIHWACTGPALRTYSPEVPGMTPAWHVPLLYIDPRTPLQTEAHLSSHLFRYSEHFIRRYGHLAYRATDTSVPPSFDTGDQSTHTHTYTQPGSPDTVSLNDRVIAPGAACHTSASDHSVSALPPSFLDSTFESALGLHHSITKPPAPVVSSSNHCGNKSETNKNKGVHLPGPPSPSSTTSQATSCH